MCGSDERWGRTTGPCVRRVATFSPTQNPVVPARPRRLGLQDRRVLRALCQMLTALCAATLLAGPAGAQEDKRLAQAREALRRAQGALQSSQQEELALQRDKAVLEQERSDLTLAVAAEQKAARSAVSKRQALESEFGQVRNERDRLQAELAALRSEFSAGQAQIEDARRQLAASTAAGDEQRRLNAALLGLLERSVTSLATVEAKNRELYRLGYQVLDAWRNATPEAQRAQSEPLLGIASVRIEDEAETYRRLMDAQRAAATP